MINHFVIYRQSFQYRFLGRPPYPFFATSWLLAGLYALYRRWRARYPFFLVGPYSTTELINQTKNDYIEPCSVGMCVNYPERLSEGEEVEAD